MALEQLSNKLQTVGKFELSLAGFIGNSFDVSGQDSFPAGVAFNSDGTRMFVMGGSSDSVFEYDLTTGFDLSTASFSGISFDVSGQVASSEGIDFSPDGTRMFVIDDNSVSVFEYDLTTGFDLSTASFSGTSFDVSGQDTGPTDVTFNPDGTQMFVIDDDADSVFEYDLTTGFDLSTASFSGISFDVSGQTNGPRDVTFNPDGTRMFIIGDSSGSVHQYSLSTGFDLSTASFSGTSFDVSGQDTIPAAVAFNPDGTRMVVTGIDSVSTFEYLVGQLTLQE